MWFFIEVGYDEVGELCIKEPTAKLVIKYSNLCIDKLLTFNKGYHNNPEANANAFDQDGFFHTGDLFQVNEKGNFTHIDRLNDVIKYKYYKVR